MTADATTASRTLLLNSTFEPLKVISWQRAVTLLWLGKVEIIRTYDRDIRAVTFRIKMPAVVRLLRFVRRKRPQISFSRRNLFARDENTCQYCGVRMPRAELNLDHVVPRSRGGATNWENVVCSCVPCNLRKGGRSPGEAGMRLLRLPSRPRWTPVFRSATRRAFYREWRPFLSLVDAAYWNAELLD